MKSTRNRKAGSPRRSPQATKVSSMTHLQLTEHFNALVPRAKKAGITWAKHHTSALVIEDAFDLALRA
jgi:hypothetical protein